MRECSNPVITKSVEQRFWKYVPERPGEGCWHWRGIEKQEYGKLYGAGGGNLRQLLAHRVSWVLHFGAIPPGVFVCHHCDKKSCVRPDHLYLGSPKQNSRDAVQRGRMEDGLRNRSRSGYIGERNGMARLSRHDVQRIRRMYREGGVRQIDLAEEFGVTRPHISGIISGKFWGWLPDES